MKKNEQENSKGKEAEERICLPAGANEFRTFSFDEGDAVGGGGALIFIFNPRAPAVADSPCSRDESSGFIGRYLLRFAVLPARMAKTLSDRAETTHRAWSNGVFPTEIWQRGQG